MKVLVLTVVVMAALVSGEPPVPNSFRGNSYLPSVRDSNNRPVYGPPGYQPGTPSGAGNSGYGNNNIGGGNSGYGNNNIGGGNSGYGNNNIGGGNGGFGGNNNLGGGINSGFGSNNNNIGGVSSGFVGNNNNGGINNLGGVNSGFGGNNNNGRFPGQQQNGLNSGAQNDPLSEPARYEFSYEVSDPPSGQSFGHSEKRDGDDTQGSYFVELPDGRLQRVVYTAGVGGYRAQVTYEEGKGQQVIQQGGFNNAGGARQPGRPF